MKIEAIQKEVLKECFGITDLTEEETAVKTTGANRINNNIVGPIISARAKIGWTTHDHTDEDVTLYTYLPGNERLTGLLENTDIGLNIAALLYIDLDREVTSLNYQ